MVVCLILLAAFLTATGLSIALWRGCLKNEIWRKLFVVIVVLSFGLGLITAYIHGTHLQTTNKLQAAYDGLMLYYDLVDNSTNEYVRYDYYDRVMKYNTDYEHHMKNDDNIWTGWLYPSDWQLGMSRIDFRLHGDNYGLR